MYFAVRRSHGHLKRCRLGRFSFELTSRGLPRGSPRTLRLLVRTVPFNHARAAITEGEAQQIEVALPKLPPAPLGVRVDEPQERRLAVTVGPVDQRDPLMLVERHKVVESSV